MDIFIGTQNQYKAKEMTSFLDNLPNVNIHFWEELNLNVDVKEDQPSLEKNAQKKAVEISQLTNWYVLTSDGGVDIPGLGSKWDILKNQRIVGENKTDLEKAYKLINLMKGLSGEERKATFYLALALAKNGKLIWSDVQITDQGYILEKLPDEDIPQYKWMSHLWYYPKYDKVFNKLSDREKSEVRLKAEKIKKKLRNIVNKLQG